MPYPSTAVILARVHEGARDRTLPHGAGRSSAAPRTSTPGSGVSSKRRSGAGSSPGTATREQTVLAGECEESIHYHIFRNTGIVELIGRDGRPVEKPRRDGRGRPPPTSPNYVCPSSAIGPGDVAACHGETVLLREAVIPLLEKVEGRLQEFIVTRNGHLISVTPINYESEL